MLKSTCQDVDGICSQCGLPISVKWRTCRAKVPRPERDNRASVVAPRSPTLIDVITRDGVEAKIQSTRTPCKHLGGKKHLRDGSPLMAKQQGCKNTPENLRPIIFTPVYECGKFRRCAPFAAKIEDEADPAHPCIGCKSYERKPPDPTKN